MIFNKADGCSGNTLFENKLTLTGLSKDNARSRGIFRVGGPTKSGLYLGAIRLS